MFGYGQPLLPPKPRPSTPSTRSTRSALRTVLGGWLHLREMLPSEPLALGARGSTDVAGKPGRGLFGFAGAGDDFNGEDVSHH